MEMGPNTVSRLRTTASGPPTDCSRVPGVVTVVVVTLPSFAGSEVPRRSGTAQAGPRFGYGPPRRGGADAVVASRHLRGNPCPSARGRAALSGFWQSPPLSGGRP